MFKEYKTNYDGFGDLKARQVKFSIPRNVINLKEQAFANNKRLRKVYIPKEVQVIGKEAFLNCERLEVISLASNSSLTKFPIRCFANCLNLAKIIIPDKIVTIEDEAFANCISISKLEIPDSVNYIDENAFSGWTKEQVIVVYKNYVFKNCEARIILINDEAKNQEKKITDEAKNGKFYYKVTAKCGHVGRQKYLEVDFPVVAINKREAAYIIRNTPRVKHHDKEAIISVTRISHQEYQALWDDNPNQDYLRCNNIQEQRRLDLSSRIKEENLKEEKKKTKQIKPLAKIDIKTIKQEIKEGKNNNHD